MSEHSNAPPSAMDVDPQPPTATNAENGQAASHSDVSGTIPSSAGAAAANESAPGDSASSTDSGPSSTSNAMDTDSAAPKPGQTASTDRPVSAASSASSSQQTKKFYGPFARYSASHPVKATSTGGHSSQGREKANSAKQDIAAPANFNLADVTAPYSGITIVDRLTYIADRCSTLSLTAYQLALDQLLSTDNTTMYHYLAERLQNVSGLRLDMQAIDIKQAQSAQEFERLELELSSYKANLIKDNVRISSRAMGDFHFARGDYGAALRAYSRMRDYCSAPSHHTDMNICQARACLQLSSFSQLLTHVARAEQQPDLDPSLANQLKSWSALSYLHDRKYKVAARRFIEIKADKLPANINETITANDIAKYATLLALSEFDRSELNTRVLTNPEFGMFLEKEPQMLQLAKSFYESQYSTCMQILDEIVPSLRLDYRIGDHIETLAKNIRARALAQYFTPFSSVDMNEMASAFNMPISAIEKELADLIVSGHISARIDSHNKRLHATESDQRSITFDKSYNAADAFRSQSMAMLLRVNLIRNNFLVKGNKNQGHPGMDFMEGMAGMGGGGGMAFGGFGMGGRHHKGR